MVCRAADEASFPPAKKSQEQEGANEDTQEIEVVEDQVMSFDERLDQPLHIKLMNCLPAVINNCCDHKFLFNPKNKINVDFGPAEQYES
jgi:hypothetical protein